MQSRKYLTFIDNIVIVVRSQHDSFHENKANLFAKKIEEQITARSIKVLLKCVSS